VLERDAADKAQGGGIDLRAAAIDAFGKLGFGERFASLTIDRDEAQFVMEDAQAHVLWQKKAVVAPVRDDGSEATKRRREADTGYSGARLYRPHLRQLLLDVCAERGVTVAFDAPFRQYEQTPGGAVRVRFASKAPVKGAESVPGEGAEGSHRHPLQCLEVDVLIGADGINSAVRRQLVGDPLVLHGYRRIGGRLEGEAAAKLANKIHQLNRDRGIEGQAKHCIMGVGCSLFTGTGKPQVTPTDASGLHPDLYKGSAIGWAFTYAAGSDSGPVQVDTHKRTPASAPPGTSGPSGSSGSGAGAVPADASGSSSPGVSSPSSGDASAAGSGAQLYWATDNSRQVAFHKAAVDAMVAQRFHPIYTELVASTHPSSVHVTDSAGYATFYGKVVPKTLDEVIARPSASAAAQAADPSQRRVTLLGDSAHPVSAWAGSGATQAIIDAMAIANALAPSGSGSGAAAVAGAPMASGAITAALGAYEADLLERGASVSKEGLTIVKFVHASHPVTAWLRNTALRMVPVFSWKTLPGSAKGYRTPSILFGMRELQLVAAVALLLLVLAAAFFFTRRV
jgi:2-polyprenyl-6-methoxyphenol hydroxylase-like FAD-dependent oxidoreductase